MNLPPTHRQATLRISAHTHQHKTHAPPARLTTVDLVVNLGRHKSKTSRFRSNGKNERKERSATTFPKMTAIVRCRTHSSYPTPAAATPCLSLPLAITTSVTHTTQHLVNQFSIAPHTPPSPHGQKMWKLWKRTTKVYTPSCLFRPPPVSNPLLASARLLPPPRVLLLPAATPSSPLSSPEWLAAGTPPKGRAPQRFCLSPFSV